MKRPKKYKKCNCKSKETKAERKARIIAGCKRMGISTRGII